MSVASAASRTVDLVVIVLVALAALVLALTVWYWRATTPLHPSLEALEEMGRKRWRRRPPAEREAALARFRTAAPAAHDGSPPVGSDVPAGHEAFAPPAPGTGARSPDGAPLPPPRGEALARHPPVP